MPSVNPSHPDSPAENSPADLGAGDAQRSGVSRKQFLLGAGLAGAAVVAGPALPALAGPGSAAVPAVATAAAGVGSAAAASTASAAGTTGAASAAGAGPILDGSRFPIGLFWPPPPFQTTLARYREIARAGFTFVLTGNYVDDPQIAGYALGFADQVGLDVLVADQDVSAMTRLFTVSDAGGPMTITEADATQILQQAINRYAGTGWHIEQGALTIRGGSGNGSVGLTNAGATWTDYTLAFDATLIDTDVAAGYSQAGWAFRATDPDNGYIWLLTDKVPGAAAAPGYLKKAVFVNGNPVSVTTVPLTVAITPGTTYRVATRVSGSTITTSINGSVIDTTTDTRFGKGRIGFRQAGQESATYDNVKVTSASGAVLFQDDFSGTLAAWTPPPSTGHPSFAGLVLFDEPSGAKVADLGTVVRLMNGLGQPLFPYVNLLPGQGAGYVDQARTIGSPVVSFDRYPLLTTGTDPGYFQNWADVRAAAKATDRPAWTFIQSVGYNGHAVPTKAGLLWQINVSLAYGCKGIQYFTYWTPDPARGEGFHDGIVDADGHKTHLYSAALQVNNDYLKPVGKELLAKVSEAVNAANLAGPPPGLPVLAADPYISGTTGSPVVLGRFGSGSTADTAKYLLGANYSATAAAKVQLSYTTAVHSVATFDPRSGRYRSTNSRNQLHLSAGAAVLLRLS